MLRDLHKLCERTSVVEADDFRMAARTILQRQFLLLERNKDRKMYRLIANHFDYFSNLFDALSWTLYRDDGFSIIGLLPGDAEAFTRLRMVDSLVLLCFRLLYEEGLEKFEVSEGSVYTQSENLLSRYETLLGRKRPQITEFRDVLARLRRYSLIEMGDDAEDGLPGIRILPTIRLVTGTNVQERIESFITSKESGDDIDLEGSNEELS
jgi:hypothetical protein